ncbi:MAG: sugar transferase [Thermoleophilia bacterium]|nr:sugar transferase [Thermoleophilia bacterium]
MTARSSRSDSLQWSSPLRSGAAAVGGAAKRALDLAIAVPLTVILAPVLLIVAIAVRRDSPGPALFRQERIGLNGRPFTLLKFRTMVLGAQSMGTGLKVTDGDSRITPLGQRLRRLSIDELPQLWNVVRGDMSVIGPRPTVAAQVAKYDAHQRRRLLARPGVTGWAQVNGRNAIPWSHRIELDIEYVERWSMMMDLKILLKTAFVVFGRENTYTGEEGAFDLTDRGPKAD